MSKEEMIELIKEMKRKLDRIEENKQKGIGGAPAKIFRLGKNTLAIAIPKRVERLMNYKLDDLVNINWNEVEVVGNENEEREKRERKKLPKIR